MAHKVGLVVGWCVFLYVDGQRNDGIQCAYAVHCVCQVNGNREILLQASLYCTHTNTPACRVVRFDLTHTLHCILIRLMLHIAGFGRHTGTPEHRSRDIIGLRNFVIQTNARCDALSLDMV